MTTSIQTSQNEFLKTGDLSSPASSGGAVIFGEFSAPTVVPLPNTMPVDALIAEYEKDSEMALLLATARQQFANTAYADEKKTFTALRLSAGLSQAQLADKVGTSQPYIARVEAGHTDPSTDVIGRLADALQLDAGTVFEGVRLQRQAKEVSR